jgi:hypothetical protein
VGHEAAASVADGAAHSPERSCWRTSQHRIWPSSAATYLWGNGIERNGSAEDMKGSFEGFSTTDQAPKIR